MGFRSEIFHKDKWSKIFLFHLKQCFKILHLKIVSKKIKKNPESLLLTRIRMLRKKVARGRGDASDLAESGEGDQEEP